MKMNRRQLGALAMAAASASAVEALAQTAPVPAAPAGVAAIPTTARDFLAEARASHQVDAAAIATIDLPQSVEPAFEFRP
jgi:hypothetical protein